MGKKYDNFRVLVVDDNNINLYTINQLLLEYGINADCVPNGKACIKKVSKKEYDLIFMDHMMPEMDGIETFAHLKENPDFKVPVIALTANEGDEYKELYAKEGFAEYLIKPLDKNAVEMILKKYAEGNECLGNGASGDSEEKQNVIDAGTNKSCDDPRRDKLIECGFAVIDELIKLGTPIDDFDMMLSIFAEESLEKKEAADEYAASDNMREYAVIVHGLKNDAGMISVMDLREEALKHEIESKAGNTAFVHENWQTLKSHWEDVLERINRYFS